MLGLMDGAFVGCCVGIELGSDEGFALFADDDRLELLVSGTGEVVGVSLT